MLIGSPKEIKNHEYRVGLTPESAKELVMQNHDVWIETQAGSGIDASDEQYVAAGAKIVDGPDAIFAECEMVVKVKEPQAVERKKLREGQILYTYLHLAPDPDQTKGPARQAASLQSPMKPSPARAGQLPLLKPMSQVAGRMSVQAGATALEKAHGGRGVLLGGVPGVMPGKVVVIGGGVVGFNAAQMAVGLWRGRNHPRPRSRSARKGRHAFRSARQHALLQCRQPLRRGDQCRSGHRCGAHSRRSGTQAGDADHAQATCRRARCWSMSRSIRAVASKRASRPRMPSRPM